MRWIVMLFLSLVLTVCVVLGLYWMLTRPGDTIDAELQGDAARGQVLAQIGGCLACHTDVKGGGAVLAGGKPLKTPFGDFVPPNITPDFEHGIGEWRLEDLSRALRLGQSPDGTLYYPAFPYDAYTKMSDQDVADLFAWLRTVEPVSEPSSPHTIGFPFNIRTGLHFWQVLYLDVERFRANPDESEVWNRGAYLVEGPGHCGACHTPRNLLGGPIKAEALAGAKGLPGNEASPAITREALEKSGFDHGSLVFALEIGMLPDGDFFGGSMTEVVEMGTSKLSAEDRKSIATYLLGDSGG